MTVVVLDSPERVAYAQKVIGKLPLDPPGWDVRIEKHVERRSVAANSRLWALHQKAAEHVGCGAAEMHEEMLCEHYGAAEVKMPNGSIRRVPVKRSSQRDTQEFRLFMDFVENFYIQHLGIFLGDDDA